MPNCRNSAPRGQNGNFFQSVIRPMCYTSLEPPQREESESV